MPDFYNEEQLHAFAARMARKPLRRCRYLNFCDLCKRHITEGQEYYDGGYGARAHRDCVVSVDDSLCAEETKELEDKAAREALTEAISTIKARGAK